MHFKGLVYRAHNPYWSFSPLSGAGAKQYGGRFNPVGVEALYTSLSETTALAEYHQSFPRRPQPTTLCAYDVDCTDIIDLTDAATAKQHKIKPGELDCAWELLLADRKTPPSWQLATRLRKQNCAGIIVPSLAPNTPSNGKNLVIWHWGDTLPHRVILIDDDNRLPKNQDSWK